MAEYKIVIEMGGSGGGSGSGGTGIGGDIASAAIGAAGGAAMTGSYIDKVLDKDKNPMTPKEIREYAYYKDKYYADMRTKEGLPFKWTKNARKDNARESLFGLSRRKYADPSVPYSSYFEGLYQLHENLNKTYAASAGTIALSAFNNVMQYNAATATSVADRQISVAYSNVKSLAGFAGSIAAGARLGAAGGVIGMAVGGTAALAMAGINIYNDYNMAGYKQASSEITSGIQQQALGNATYNRNRQGL